jgi:hypothetical protein
MATALILKHANASRSSSQWRDDDYDVFEDGVIVGRIFLSPGAPHDRQWMWASGHNGDIKRARDGYEATREAAMAAFAKSWRDLRRWRQAFRLREPVYSSRRSAKRMRIALSSFLRRAALRVDSSGGQAVSWAASCNT